jgi:DNA-binding SARP family transcriptional activator/predicted ATPase
MLEFRMLGPLEVRRGSTVVDLGSQKQRAVVAALLVEANRVVSLDRLIEELWGGEPPARATSTLQAYISNLRRALEPDRGRRMPSRVLVTQPPGYVLRVEPNDVDTIRFEALVSRGRRLLGEGSFVAARDLLNAALALWRGPALADLAHEAFVQSEATRLEELRLAALEDRLQADLILGNHAEIVPELEALMGTHPYRERLWGFLMLALYRSGRQVDALNAYQTARAILADELGIDPSPELQKLQVEILQQDPALGWRGSPTRTSSTPLETVNGGPRQDRPVVRLPWDRVPLVGRGRPLEQLVAALGEAMAGMGRLVLISGEPGIGKTRLAEELGVEAGRRGALVVWGRCVEGEASPTLWPWTQSFRQLMGAPESEGAMTAVRADLAELLPELAEAAGPSDDLRLKDPATARARLHGAVARLMTTISATRPIVVILDDLQWADVASLSLLHFLASQVQDTRVLLLATHRDVDLAADASLTQALGALVREPAVALISLRGLTNAEVGQFLEQSTGHVPASELVTTVHHRTAGNPFFLSELVRLLDSEAPGGNWTTVLAHGVPSAVRDVVRRRLARLPDKTVLLLKTAAVIGREFDLPLVERITGLSADTALDAVEAALITGLIHESEHRAEGYRFAHDIVRQTLSAEVGAARRSRLHAAIADAFERVYPTDRPEHVVELATHMWEGARHLRPGRVAAALLRSAVQMMSQLDYEQARLQLERAASLVDSVTPGEERNELDIAIHLRLGLIRMVRSGYASPEAGREFDRARRVLGRAVRSGPDVLAALWGSWAFHSGRCDFDTALTVSGELLELGTRTSDARALMVGHQSAGIVCFHTGRLLDSEHHLSESIRISDASRDDALVGLLQSAPHVIARAALSLTQALRGIAEEAERLNQQAWEFSVALDHPFTTVLVLSHAARLAVLHRDVDRSLEWSRKMVELATRHGYTQFTTGGGFIEGWALSQSGRTAEAITKMRQAMADFESMKARISLQFFLGLQAEAELSAGHIDHALEATKRGLTLSATSGERFYEAELSRLLGEILLQRDRGRTDVALQSLSHAIAVAREQGAGLLEQRALATIRSLGMLP